ncbi:MAG: hypothetical protein JWM11_2472 [Planctomycetaceae bacterium]|nr:hypothetical protein [Planctomycetaceae bacterium]
MAENSTGPSQLVRHVYRENIKYFGEPDDSFVFDNESGSSPVPNGVPGRIDVFVWHAAADLGMTTFSTIGMCDKSMTGADHRAELHFAVRERLAPDEVQKCARFLANLAVYPFLCETNLDWWHKIEDPGKIPLFSNAKCLLFYPRFVESGWDLIEVEDATVKLLNVIPISADAYKLKSRDELMDYVWNDLADPFAPW